MQAAAACTGNRAIFASGSPFADVRGADGEVTMRCNQSNNFYIFPGVGLGAVVNAAFAALRTAPSNPALYSG